MGKRGLQISYLADARQVGTALRQIELAHAGFGAQLQNLGGRVTAFGNRMGSGIRLPALLAAGAIAHLGLSFEKEMTKITTLVGIAEEQVHSWKEQILGLAGAVGRGPQELAEAMFFVTSAGFQGEGAMKILEASAQAAAIGLGEVKSVADTVTSAVAAYGSENLSAADATDVLLAAVREGKLEAEDLAPVLGRVIPIASELGVEFHEVGAAVAGMSRTGLNAAESVTALRGLLASLLKPAQQSREQLSRLGFTEQDLMELTGGLNLALTKSGLTIDTLRDTVADRGLFAGLDLLKTAVGDNRDALGRIIPNVRAMTGFLSLMGNNADENAVIFQRLAASSGDTAAAFEKLAKDPAFRVEQAMSSLKGSLVSMGSVALPIIADVATSLTGLFTALGKLPTPAKAAALSLVAFVTFGGPAIAMFGRMITMVGGVARGIRFLTTSRLHFWLAEAGVKGIEAAEGIGAMGKAALAARARIMGMVGALGALVALGALAVKQTREQAEDFKKIGEEYVRTLTRTDPSSALTRTREAIGNLSRELNAIGPTWFKFWERASLTPTEVKPNRADIIVAQLEQLKRTEKELTLVVQQEETNRKNVAAQMMAERTVALQALGAAAGAHAVSEAAASSLTVEAINKQKEAAEKFASAVQGAFTSSTSVVQNFASEATVKGAEVMKFFEDTVKSAQNWSSNLKTLSEAGLDQGLLKELAEAGPKAAPLVAALLEQVKKGNLEAINKAQADLRTTLDNTLIQLRDSGVAAFDEGKLLGFQIGNGVAQGITDAEGAITDAADKTVKKAMDAARSRYGISSPSQVMAEEIGLPLAQGIAEGIARGEMDLIRALESISAPRPSKDRTRTPAVATGGSDILRALEGLTVVLDGEQVGRLLSRRVGSRADARIRGG